MDVSSINRIQPHTEKANLAYIAYGLILKRDVISRMARFMQCMAVEEYQYAKAGEIVMYLLEIGLCPTDMKSNRRVAMYVQ